MGITKTDYVRGMQCPRMLWLDKHHPELRVIPPEVRARLRKGNEFGDSMMGVFGPYTEVREYRPGTQIPDKKKMAAKTTELMAEKTPVICEAAFMDKMGNYCAADILKYDSEDGSYVMYEVKNSPEVTDQHIRDAGYQAYIIRELGFTLKGIFILYHGDEPYSVKEITDEAGKYAETVGANIEWLGNIREQEDEVRMEMGPQCTAVYGCWYTDYCSMCREGMMDRKRCGWVNLSHPLYVRYHDEEWGVPCHDDRKLFECLMLEMFQAGLSFETILRKRENFRKAFENFEPATVAEFSDTKKAELMQDSGIVRNRLKIDAAVANAGIFLQLQKEYGSFDSYIWGFTDGEVLIPDGDRANSEELAARVGKDLRKKGMRFLGGTIVYSFLETVGIINSHEKECFRFSEVMK